ncbi:MAG: recombination protein RecR [Gammaproteobacteria bacterium]|nr:recombination protein RecR [Gammaproteobacteria bacterium]
MSSPLIEQLINALRCLPGVGPKTAQRMAFQLLQHNRENGLHLARILNRALTEVAHCTQCHTLCENELCRLCDDPKRDPSLLCVVGTPMDVIAFEQTGNFRGHYFVLMGHLSPLDGIGPKEIGIEKLAERLKKLPIQEMILATSTTVEGEATAHYIANMVKDNPIKCTRIAYGVPVGGELEYLNVNTLARAFAARTSL